MWFERAESIAAWSELKWQSSAQQPRHCQSRAQVKFSGKECSSIAVVLNLSQWFAVVWALMCSVSRCVNCITSCNAAPARQYETRAQGATDMCAHADRVADPCRDFAGIGFHFAQCVAYMRCINGQAAAALSHFEDW